MKKTRSKKKIASTSKRQQINKVSRKDAKRNASKLCSCVGHQLSSDSSSEDLAVKGQSHSAIDCGKIKLPVPAYMKRWTSEEELAPTEVPTVIDESHLATLKSSNTSSDEGGISHSRNTASISEESSTNANHRPIKTRSSELIRLFYTIVADDSFISEPSDSEDSVTSDVQHEVEVDVHDNTTEDGIIDNANISSCNTQEASIVSSKDQAVTKNVDTASESSSHSKINVQNVNRDDSEKGTWFATGHHWDFSSPTIVLQSEKDVLSLTEVTEEIGYCELSPPAANDGTDTTLDNGYTTGSQELYNEVQLEEYTDYDYQEEQNNVFENEASLYVIEEVPEDDCDAISNISVETVKDIGTPCHSDVGVEDTPLDGLETQLDLSLVDSKDTPHPAPAPEDAIEPCEDAIVAEDCTKICEGAIVNNPMNQILVNDEQTIHVRLMSNATSNPQEGSMVFSQDQAVTEIIATGSRMVDEVKELISELLDVCMHSRGNDVAPVAAHGDFVEASETFSPADSLEAYTEDPGDNVHRSNSSGVCDLNGTDILNLSLSDELHVYVPVEQSENDNQSLPWETHDIGTISGSSNNHCAEAGSSSYEPQHKTQLENAISDTQSNNANKSTDCDDNDENPTELLMSHNQYESDNDEAADQTPIIISDNAPHEFNDMLRCTDEVWPVKKIEGYDLADVKPIHETNDHDTFHQESTQIKKIVGVDIEPESTREETRLKNIASDEEDAEGDVQTLVGNQIVKIVGVDVGSSTLDIDEIKNFASDEGDVEEVGQPLVENHIVKIVGVDVHVGSSNLDIDEIDIGDIKIIGLDVEAQLHASVASESSPNSVQVDEEGDSTRMEDMSPFHTEEGNKTLKSEVRTDLHLMEDHCQDVANTCTGVTRGNGDTILATGGCHSDDNITKESGENEVTKTEKLGAEKVELHQDSPSGHRCFGDDASDEATGYDETQSAMHLPTFPRRARNQENNSPSECGSLINDSSNVFAGSPCLSHSSFEIISHEYLQDVMEDGFVMVPYSPTIILPPPQEEYNEEFMSPEFEADDIIVNIATVSAMGDVPPAQRRSGVSPIAPSPESVQFRDVNSRSPSPLPQTDLNILDCLFDICEDRLQRFPLKIPHPGAEAYIYPKSKTLELSPDYLYEQGDNIQNVDNQKSSAISKELFGTMSGDDEGFFCCDPASSESYCSLPSTEAVHERPLMTEEDSSESFFSFDTFADVIETEQEPLLQQIDTRPKTFPELGIQRNLDDQINLYDFMHPTRDSDVSHRSTDGTFISQVTKEPQVDNEKQSEGIFGTLDLSMGVSKEEETDENFVFFLALFTCSMCLYCKYGTRVLEIIMHWIWICQLIIQLFIDS